MAELALTLLAEICAVLGAVQTGAKVLNDFDADHAVQVPPAVHWTLTWNW
jgi:hypothetical protein